MAPGTDPSPDLSQLRMRWEERAKLAPYFFTDLLHHGDSAAWERAAEGEAALFAHGFLPREMASGRYLEIGCGPARLLARLAPRFAAAVGVDVSHTMLELALTRCQGLAHVGLIRTGGADLACLADRSFRLVVMQAVAIHLPLPLIAGYVAESHRVLQPGGRLRFVVNLAVPGSRQQAAEEPEGQDEPGTPPGSGRLMRGFDWCGHAFARGEIEAFMARFPFSWARVVEFENHYAGVDAVK